MPATRHHFSCGHLGFGAHCHRCEQAKILWALADKPKNKWPTRFKDWSTDDLLREAQRLKRNPKSEPTLEPALPTG